MGRCLSLSVVAILFILALLYSPVLAKDSVDVSGKWSSKYSFGPIEEVMTADIQQMGDNLLGSFSVKQSPSGDEYSGIIFGTLDGGNLKVYYLSTRGQDGNDPLVTITFTESTLVNKDTQKGNFYYQDSNQIRLSGDYEAHRI